MKRVRKLSSVQVQAYYLHKECKPKLGDYDHYVLFGTRLHRYKVGKGIERCPVDIIDSELADLIHNKREVKVC